MLRLDRLVLLALAFALLAATGCSRLTFIKPNMKKMKVEQVRQPVRAHDSPEVKARYEAAAIIQAAGTAYANNNLPEAKKQAEAALKRDPNSIDAHTLLGAIAQQQGNAAQAGVHFKRAAELSQGRGAETSNYGAWLCSQGRQAESLEYFDYAARSQEAVEQSTSLANAGRCANEIGMTDRAEGYLRRALDLDDQNALALEAMAGLKLQRGQGMEARAFIERRLAIRPITASTLRLASQIERQLGDSRAAAQYDERLKREFPINTPTSPGS